MSNTSEQRLRRKCYELRKRITEVDESNQIATLAILRTKAHIRRLRLEYAILLERLEEQSLLENGDVTIQKPPSPTFLTEALNYSSAKSYENQLSQSILKRKSSAQDAGGSSAGAQRLRDPDLPKRPSNAYLIYCDIEKERVRKQLDEDPMSAPNDLSKTLTEEWKNLDDESRKPYYKLYEEDRERYQREMSIYNQRRQVAEDEENQTAERSNLKKPKIGTELVDQTEAKSESNQENLLGTKNAN